MVHQSFKLVDMLLEVVDLSPRQILYLTVKSILVVLMKDGQLTDQFFALVEVTSELIFYHLII